MRHTWSAVVAGGLAAIGCAAAPAGDAARLAVAQDPAEQEAWVKASTPGEHHAHLMALVGKWTVKSKVWMEPGAPAQESEGSCEYEAILGGRFLQQDYEGSMIGMDFEGLGLWGYDNVKKVYQNVWCDSMGTMLMATSGTCSDGGKTITLTGEFTDHMAKVHGVRLVTKVLGPDSHTFEFFDIGADGKEAKVIELAFTRKGEAKAAPPAPPKDAPK